MIVADMEATGLDVRRHAMVGLGAVDFDDPTRTFYAEPRAWQGAETNADALAVNGFTAEQCADPSREPLESVMRRFYEWVMNAREHTLVGQNTSSDRDFINDSLSRSHISWRFSYRTIDLHSIAYADHLRRGLAVPLENGRTALNLDAILEYVGLPPEPSPHVALNGAKLEAEALSRILYGKCLLPEYTHFAVPPMFVR